jgi:hypothetical protein
MRVVQHQNREWGRWRWEPWRGRRMWWFPSVRQQYTLIGRGRSWLLSWSMRQCVWNRLLFKLVGVRRIQYQLGRWVYLRSRCFEHNRWVRCHSLNRRGHKGVEQLAHKWNRMIRIPWWLMSRGMIVYWRVEIRRRLILARRCLENRSGWTWMVWNRCLWKGTKVLRRKRVRAKRMKYKKDSQRWLVLQRLWRFDGLTVCQDVRFVDDFDFLCGERWLVPPWILWCYFAPFLESRNATPDWLNHVNIRLFMEVHQPFMVESEKTSSNWRDHSELGK